MVQLKWEDGKNTIANEEGVQVTGNKMPNQHGGLSPRELLEASVALCVSITLESILERDQLEVDKNEIKVDVQASKADGVNNRFTDIIVHVNFPKALDSAYKEKLVKKVERGCTISNTLKGDVHVELSETL